MTIMRFKRGNKVEVFGQKEVPTGSWRCAEIICGNGHYYTVKFDGDVACNEEMFERVPRKMIRPCPPLMKVDEIWAPHDVVEVFHCFSWKMATIVKALPTGEYLVRILGSFHEFKVTRYDLRARLCWQDDEWVAIGKGYDISQDWRPNVPSNVRYTQNSGLLTVNGQVKDGCLVTRNISSIPESQAVPSRTLKRRFPFCDTSIESHAGPRQKMRVNEKENMDLQFISLQHSQLPEKVDAFAYSGKSLGAKCTQRSFKNRITGCSEMICEKEKIVGDIGCSHAISLESRDGDSCSSSVGSCSVSRDYPYELPYAFSTVPLEANDSHCSDAESFCRLGFEEGNCLLPSDEGLTAEIHRLELHAYRCTMESLHASGPLSWEQETLLTNLRDSLHISNDEHLMELRNLISNSTCIPTS